MQIRKATMKDAEALLSLYEDLGYPTTASKLSRRLEMILSQPHYGCLLAERNGEILGFLGYAKLFFFEADNDYFNTGIVDVSHEYEKMYVVRPQFFIQLIGLLRNAALNSLKYKQELALIREQNIDITHFEEDLDAFKVAFAKNYNSASVNFGKAIDEIDKAIKRMEEVKKFLTTSENQLRLANNKLDDVSGKKVTRKNPTMKAKFDALKGE